MWTATFEADGYLLLPGVFAAEAESIRDDLTAALQASSSQSGAISSESAGVYAARNVLKLWPRAADIWRQPQLVEPLTAILGEGFGLVRALYFDKPPEQSWALPWHKDVSIAVADNRIASSHFRKPTIKAGVPHVEAPLEILQRMVTARIHLDEVTLENGPLRVLPGSRRNGKAEIFIGEPVNIFAQAGDLLLMRPLLMHSSNRSIEGTRRHRRILHLEFAANADLPNRYEWHTFIGTRQPVCTRAT